LSRPLTWDELQSLDEYLRRLPQNDAHKSKIVSSEYLLRPRGDNEFVASYDPFEKTFKPGAYIEMSMVFDKSFNGRCPGCDVWFNNSAAASEPAKYDWCVCSY